MKKSYLILVFLFFFLTPYSLSPTPTLAQGTPESLDLTSVYNIIDKEAQDGDILISTNQGLERAKTSLDSHIFGILQTQPLLTFRRFDNTGQPVARNGTAKVNVTTLNGPIQQGDYITSSEIPGKGQKASGAGYVLGVALAPFTEKDGAITDYTPTETKKPQKITSGQVMVAIKIEYAEISKSRNASRLMETFSGALFSSIKDPDKFTQLFKYIMAGLAVLISFSVGFFTFSRSIPKGIEAIGRNPLAQKVILFSIILNVVFTILTAAAGIVAAVFILKL